MKRNAGTSSVSLSAPAGAASVHLDALRGVAAFWVFLSHWRDCLFVDYADVHSRNPLLSAAYLFTGLGHQWVVVFFVLSGYLVGGSVLRQVSTDRWSWSDYALNRLTRLYTVLIPALVLGGLLDWAGIHLFGTGGIYGGHTGVHEIAANIGSRLSLPIAIGNYAFLQDIRVPVLGTNGPLWSLSYEFWYYLAFPLLIFALWVKRSVSTSVVSACLLTLVIASVGRDVAVLGFVWLMGVAIHWLPVKKPSSVPGRRLWLGSSLLATIATLAACKLVHYHAAGFRRFVPSDLALGVVVMLLVYSLLMCSENHLPAAYTSIAKHAAKSSYTLYLVHVPAVVFLTAWLRQLRWQPDATHVCFGLAILAGVFLYAQIVYYCFERNTSSLRAWLRVRLLASRPVPARPIAESSRIPAAMPQ